MQFDPKSFVLATDVAQTYYGIKPFRFDEARNAWKTALKLANDDIEKEGVYIHMARIEWMAGNLDQSEQYLMGVTNQVHQVMKQRIMRNIEEKKTKSKAAAETNDVVKPTPEKAPEKTPQS
jgi:hypothetical protein